MLLVLAVVSFLAGIVTGAALREAFPPRSGGHTCLMCRLNRFLRTNAARYVGVALVVAALAANAAVGFLAITTRVQTTELVECVARYNALEGQARDARARETSAERLSQARLWRSIRDEFRTEGGPDGDRLEASITAYLDALQDVRQIFAQNPYPRPDLCAGSRRGGVTTR